MAYYNDFNKPNGYRLSLPNYQQQQQRPNPTQGMELDLPENTQQGMGLEGAASLVNAGSSVALGTIGAITGPNRSNNKAQQRGNKAAQGIETGAQIGSAVIGGLAMAGLAANAVPLAGQIASGALMLAAGLTKLFAGKRQAKKARRRGQREYGMQQVASNMDGISQAQSTPGGYGNAQQEMQPEGITPFDMPDSPYFRG